MADRASSFPLSLLLTPSAWSAHLSRGGSGDPPTDEVLLRRAGRGDELAFGELLRRHESRLREFIRCMLGAHAHVIEDVMQDVLLQLHRSARTFANGSTFRTWLYGLAKNVCRQELRKRRRHVELESVDEEPLRQIKDERLDPLEALTREEREAAIRRAVSRLPPHYRTVLELRDWDQLSYAQIAQVLDVPIGTVRSRLHNARVLLADVLGPWNPEGGR